MNHNLIIGEQVTSKPTAAAIFYGVTGRLLSIKAGFAEIECEHQESIRGRAVPGAKYTVTIRADELEPLADAQSRAKARRSADDGGIPF